MSSRNQKNFLQLSIATLFLFQFFLMFTPTMASTFLSNIRFENNTAPLIRYELKINAIDNKNLPEPILLSQSWFGLGIEDYGETQLLIDDLARALNQKNMVKAQSIYSELTENHIQNLESYQFEIQQIRIIKAPPKTVGASGNGNIINQWSSDELDTD